MTSPAPARADIAREDDFLAARNLARILFAALQSGRQLGMDDDDIEAAHHVAGDLVRLTVRLWDDFETGLAGAAQRAHALAEGMRHPARACGGGGA